MSDPLLDAITAALGAQYDVVRLIGRGGMGAVYLGHERLLDRPVAIKVLPHESADTADARERFLREARTAAKLTHPHVVPLLSFGEAGRTLFYIMGYVEGESLEQRLRRDGRLPFDEARRILSELAAALEHAHGHGIVHRDLKPDNVLLEAGTGRAVLTDFGIAKQAASGHTLTQTGMVVGTPHYMSPEQAAGERDIDGRSDLYALGVMGYRMLTGRLPFEGGSLQEVLAQHVTRAAAPIGTLVPDVPPDLETAVGRCLEKDPSRRWQSAAILREALGAGDVELALPDTLDRMPASASTSALLAIGATIVSLLAFLITKKTIWIVPIAMWISVPLGIVGGIVRGRKHGIPARHLARIAFWPPRWWGGLWWPARLRRPGDVWSRLPRNVRRLRGFMSASVGLMFGIWFPFMMADVLTVEPLVGPGVGLGVLVAMGLLALVLTPSLVYANLRWRKRYGLTEMDVSKLMREPTWNSRFWKRPEIARLLEVPVPSSPAGLTDPGEIAVALERLGSGVDDGLRPVVQDAAAAAREAAAAIAALDAELRALARDADPEERDRLRQRLAALGPARAEEPASSRQMRELLAGQLALVENLVARHAVLAAKRGRAMDLARGLWLRVADVRAQRAGSALDAAEMTGRVREVCREVERALEARHDVGVIAPTLETPTTPIPR